MRCLAVVLASLALANISSAQGVPKLPPPPSLPPSLKIVAEVDRDRGNFVFVETVTRFVEVTKEVEVMQNGMVFKRTVTESVPVMEMRMVAHAIKDNRFMTAGGKKIAPDDVLNRLKKGAVVAVSGNNVPPAAAFLQALNAETIVINPTRVQGDFIPPPPPPPPPPKKADS